MRPPGASVTEQDRLLMRALHMFEGGLCRGGCGQHKDDSMNPDHDRADPEHVAHYEAGAPWECLACAELQRAQEKYRTAYGDSGVSHLQWVVELVPNRLRAHHARAPENQ